MSAAQDILVPDLGDFEDVEIIEVHAKAGDTVVAEDPLITLESDKAAMEVPSPVAGTVTEMLAGVGDRVSTGTLIARVVAAEAGTGTGPAVTPAEPATPAAAPAPIAAAGYDGRVDQEAEVLVLGAGPGGYTAAFRAADLGLKVTLVERWPVLGGVCLNVGCIPSKALLHAARVIEETQEMADCGIRFGAPEIDRDGLRGWKDKVVSRLVGGLATLAGQRKVTVVQGEGRFLSPHHLEVSGEQGDTVIAFRQCIIAAGSEAAMLPGLPDDPRVIDSTGALELRELPERMLVVGGGIIGLEMACVYDALGVKISVVELTDQLMPGVDKDLLRPFEKRIRKRYEAIMLKTGVTRLDATEAGITVHFDGEQAPDGPQTYGLVLVAVGRKPNGAVIDAGKAGVTVDKRGFIPVDKQQRTNVPHIFAIGDIVGQPMLAHKATHEAKVAAEVAAGEKRFFDARVIPSVAYTDPEIAWIGVTETEAKAQGLKYGKGAFPWAASGRALALARDEGLTKILFDEDTGRIIGGGIVGPNAGDLIAELGLAIEMGCDAEDIGLTIHPHPTLSETVAMAAEAFDGTLTDLYLPKQRKA
ncbi:MAG: dihydrolipoyl dehydrogenase [Chromatiales bacterium]|nr:MAG: dihydrolipoyl dehydrogenase [Chromatiales bacterium]